MSYWEYFKRAPLGFAKIWVSSYVRHRLLFDIKRLPRNLFRTITGFVYWPILYPLICKDYRLKVAGLRKPATCYADWHWAERLGLRLGWLESIPVNRPNWPWPDSE